MFAFKYCFTTTKTSTAEKLITYHGHVIFFMGLVIHCLAGGCDEVGLVEILRLLTARNPIAVDLIAVDSIAVDCIAVESVAVESVAVESVTGESDDIICCL